MEMNGKGKGKSKVATGSSSQTTTVVFEDEEVEVLVEPQQFTDFDNWARRRFAFATSDAVLYYNSKGQGSCVIQVSYIFMILYV
jgi:hypothetical protein